jgi:glycosyltransferase involved in cell wall biosynthesis
MKVGVVLDDGSPETMGGAVTFQLEILQGLLACKSRSRDIVLIQQQTQSNREPAVAGESELSNLAISWRVWKLSKAQSILREKLHSFGLVRPRFTWFDRIVRANNIDILWFVSPRSVEATELPYVYTVWDLQHRLQPWFPEVGSNGLWRRYEQKYSTAIRRAWRIIVGTEVGKEEVSRFYQVPDERIRVLPLPAPRHQVRSIDGGTLVRNKYGLPKQYLFYPAQFWPNKNHIGLLSAVELLLRKYGLTLPVVLTGSDRGNLNHVRAAVEKLGLSGQVHFLGFVAREDLPDLYRNALALVYPTFFGPDNLPPLEAFVAGCPVISSNYSGASEQLGSAALLVDADDCGAWALAIKRIYEDSSLRDRLVRDGFARVENWNSETYVREVLCAIEDFEPTGRCWGKDFVLR